MECKMALACFGLDYQNDGPKILHLQLTYSENSQGFHPFWALDPKGDHLLPLGDWLAIFIA